MTTTLAPFNLTPLGLFHTLVSLVAVVSAFVALYRDQGIPHERRSAGCTCGPC